MEKLNELPQAFYGIIQDGKVLMLPADDGQWLNKTTVVEAFRALERTGDVNMAAAQAMRDDMYHWKQRAEAAEAKLAGLESREALGWQFEQCEGESCDNGAVVNVSGADVHLCAECSRDKKYSRMKINALPKRLTRPAPAVDQVPEGWVLVPVEPTDDMVAAGTSVDGGVYCIWKDMLTAAPEAK